MAEITPPQLRQILGLSVVSQVVWVRAAWVLPLPCQGWEKKLLGATKCADERDKLAGQVLYHCFVRYYQPNIYMVAATSITRRQTLLFRLHCPPCTVCTCYCCLAGRSLLPFPSRSGCKAWRLQQFFSRRSAQKFFIPEWSSRRPATPWCWRIWPGSWGGLHRRVLEPHGSWSRQTHASPGTYRTK
jgi:hypothetical protein